MLISNFSLVGIQSIIISLLAILYISYEEKSDGDMSRSLTIRSSIFKHGYDRHIIFINCSWLHLIYLLLKKESRPHDLNSGVTQRHQLRFHTAISVQLLARVLRVDCSMANSYCTSCVIPQMSAHP